MCTKQIPALAGLQISDLMCGFYLRNICYPLSHCYHPRSSASLGILCLVARVTLLTQIYPCSALPKTSNEDLIFKNSEWKTQVVNYIIRVGQFFKKHWSNVICYSWIYVCGKKYKNKFMMVGPLIGRRMVLGVGEGSFNFICHDLFILFLKTPEQSWRNVDSSLIKP